MDAASIEPEKDDAGSRRGDARISSDNTPHSTLEGDAYVALCAALPDAKVTLIRAGSACVFLVRTDATRSVARVSDADLTAQARYMTRTAMWLSQAGIPVATPVREEPEPLPCPRRELVVTFWHHVEHNPGALPPAEQVGDLVAALHLLDPPSWMPHVDLLEPARRWLPSIAAVDDRELIARRLHGAESLCDRITRRASRVVVHGDLPTNILASESGPVMIDLETAGVGPSAWDLARFVAHARRFGRSEQWLSHFLSRYEAAGGIADPADVEEFDQVTVLLGASFAAYGAHRSPAHASEASRRLQTLRDGSELRWNQI